MELEKQMKKMFGKQRGYIEDFFFFFFLAILGVLAAQAFL